MFHPNNNHYNFILEDTAVERQHDRLTQGALNFHKHPRELIIYAVFQPTSSCDIGGFVGEYKGAFVPVVFFLCMGLCLEFVFVV